MVAFTTDDKYLYDCRIAVHSFFVIRFIWNVLLNVKPFQVHFNGTGLLWISNQIKPLLLSHHHSTSALVSEILMSVLQTVQKNKNKKQQFTYGQYIFTDCTEDNVQNTHTYTQYT